MVKQEGENERKDEDNRRSRSGVENGYGIKLGYIALKQYSLFFI